MWDVYEYGNSICNTSLEQLLEWHESEAVERELRDQLLERVHRGALQPGTEHQRVQLRPQLLEQVRGERRRAACRGRPRAQQVAEQREHQLRQMQVRLAQQRHRVVNDRREQSRLHVCRVIGHEHICAHRAARTSTV